MPELILARPFANRETRYLRRDVKRRINKITSRLRDAVQAAHEAGLLLCELKEHRFQHGEWLPYLEEIELTPRTAQRYMKLARSIDPAQLGTFSSITEALKTLETPKLVEPEQTDAPRLFDHETETQPRTRETQKSDTVSLSDDTHQDDTETPPKRDTAKPQITIRPGWLETAESWTLWGYNDDEQLTIQAWILRTGRTWRLSLSVPEGFGEPATFRSLDDAKSFAEANAA